MFDLFAMLLWYATQPVPRVTTYPPDSLDWTIANNMPLFLSR